MELSKIKISNYRSIENLEVDINEVDESKTYALLGINESGKSSFLQALSLLDPGKTNHLPILSRDYFDEEKEVHVLLKYSLKQEEEEELRRYLAEEKGFPEDLVKKVEVKSVDISVKYSSDGKHTQNKQQSIEFKTSIFEDYTLTSEGPVSKSEKLEENQNPFNLGDYFKESLPSYFLNISHKLVFWKSSPQYLILDEIDLNSFSTNPEQISIPLLNCFALADIKEEKIKKINIDSLKNFAEIHNLQQKLGEKVTEHIKNIWPEHPIKVKFQISNEKISFLIEDEGTKYAAKTTNQRSDGFRQFISFLLTLSIESRNNKLENTILLIDEPEVHLHPLAQINLLKELIKITKNNQNNLVFFATHSNYLVDKENLNRCYKVIKDNTNKTTLNKIKGTKTTYAEVNFEVFDVLSTDYHNELYGYLEKNQKEKLNALPKNKKWKKKTNKEEEVKEEEVSLQTYIRHTIHHPENKSNKSYTDEELKESINTLRKLKSENEGNKATK